MNRLFKRVVSSVLAAAMMVGSVTVANVSSVFAAMTVSKALGTDAGVKAISADKDSYLYYYNMTSVSSGSVETLRASDYETDNTHTASIKLTSGNVNVVIGGTTVSGQKASNGNDNVIYGIKAGQTVVFDFIQNSTDACTMKFNKGSAASSATNPYTLELGTTKTSYQVSVNVDEDTDLYFYYNKQLAISNIGVKTTGQLASTYSVTGSVSTSDNANLAGSTFDVYSGTDKKATATISENGTSYTLNNELEDGTYTFTADLAEYTLSANEVTVNGADVTNADVTFTAKPTYTVGGEITGATVDDGTTFTLTNKDYSDVTATATVNSNSYTTDKNLIAGTYEISGLDVEGYALKSSTIEVGENGNTEIAFIEATAKSFSYWFDTATRDKGTYTLDGGKVVLFDNFTTNKTSYSYTDSNGIKHTAYQGAESKAYESATATTAIASGATTIPVRGNAYSFTPYADGTVKFYGATASAKSYNFLIVDTAGNATVEKLENTSVTAKEVKVHEGYTYYMLGTNSTGGTVFVGFEYIKAEKLTINGTITKTDADSYTLPSTITFTSSDDAVTTDVDSEGKFSVTLDAGTEYDITTNSVDLMITSDQTITATSDLKTNGLAVAMTVAQAEEVTGEVVGLDNPSGVTITFTKGGTPTTATVDSTGKYTVSLLPGTYSVAVSSVDGYTASSLSTADFTVKQSSDSTAENWKNVLYTKAATAVTSEDVYVGYDGNANNFDTITEAMDAINVSSKSKYVVHIAPGTYTEQVIVKANNVTFTNDNAGVVTISWYYGIDYSYYSCNNGYYDKAYAVDKHAKGTPDRWGCAVQVKGNNFYAEGITFENTFNRSKTEAEVADGVTLLGVAKNTTVDRTTDFDPKAAASTERAAALAIDNNRAELYNCKMLGSQDTLYLNTGVYYFNGCTIQGQTDYIFSAAGSNAVFDNCNLVWAGYSTGAKEGYITAARGSMLFRKCTISTANDLSNSVVAGFLGRHWGDKTKVIFADTEGISSSTIVASDYSKTGGSYTYKNVANFQMPSSLTKTNATDVVTNADGSTTTYDVREYYATTNADYTGEKYIEPTEVDSYSGTQDIALTATDVTGATYLGSWTPENYAFAEVETDENETSDTVTATWDFQNATPSSITSVNIQGTTNTVASDVDGIELTVNAEVTNGKLQYNAAGYAQYNNGTIIKVPVYAEGDVITIVAYPGQYKYTVAGTAAEANETTYTAKASDVETGYIEIVATGGAYIYSITLVTTKKPETVTKTTATWDFQNATPSSITSVNIQGTTNTVASDVDGIELTVNAEVTNGKLQYNAAGYAQYNNGTIIKVPVYAEGDVITIVAYPGQYKYTVAGTAAEANETTYTAKASDVETGYVEIVATGGAYIYSITLVTTGTPSTSTTETTNYIKAITAKTVAGTDTYTAYLFATVSAADVDNIDKVGFIIAPSEYATGEAMATDTDVIKPEASSTVYEEITYGDSQVVKASDLGNGSAYATGLKITDISNSVKVYYTAYAVGKDGTTTYFDVDSVSSANN